MSLDLNGKLTQSAKKIKELTGLERLPDTLVTLGSGFKKFEDKVENAKVIPLSKIDHFPVPKVEGHGSNLIVGTVDGRDVAVLTGRVHMYEGHSANDVVYYIRAFAKAGVKRVVLTNASGSVDPKLTPGTVMSITDQINLTGRSCLMDEGLGLGPMFLDMGGCYDKSWQKAIHALDETKEGVYIGLMGPAYETPAEARMIAALGANSVGMSTVQEVMAARQIGLKVAGLSLVTNMSGGIGDGVDHQEVLDVASQNADRLAKLLTAAISVE